MIDADQTGEQILMTYQNRRRVVDDVWKRVSIILFGVIYGPILELGSPLYQHQNKINSVLVMKV